MVVRAIERGDYAKFIVKGDLSKVVVKGVLYEEWSKIWNTGLDRLHTADFEMYGEKAQNSTDTEVEISVAINWKKGELKITTNP